MEKGGGRSPDAFRLSPSARQDLLEITGHIADRDGTARALTIADRLHAAMMRTAEMPGIGRERPDLTHEAVRWWIVGPWWIVYKVEPSSVVVLRVVHAGRLRGQS